MKKLSVLALVLAFTMMLSVVSFAADPAFKVVEREDAAYNPEVTTVTPGADSIAVSTAATNDAYYGVLLINGSALPTVDDDILFIDQATAKNNSVAFNVKPILPTADLEKPLTLYISSNATGEGLIKVPVAYGAETPVEPPVVEPEVLVGDVDGLGDISDEDAYIIYMYTSFMYDEMLEQYGVDFESENFILAGDVDQADGEVTDEDAYVIYMYTSFMYDEILEQYGVKIGDMIDMY